MVTTIALFGRFSPTFRPLGDTLQLGFPPVDDNPFSSLIEKLNEIPPTPYGDDLDVKIPVSPQR